MFSGKTYVFYRTVDSLKYKPVKQDNKNCENVLVQYIKKWSVTEEQYAWSVYVVLQLNYVVQICFLTGNNRVKLKARKINWEMMWFSQFNKNPTTLKI